MKKRITDIFEQISEQDWTGSNQWDEVIWKCIRYAIKQDWGNTYQIAFDNPEAYVFDSVDPAIFIKIIESVASRELDPESALIAFRHFSSSCNKREWEIYSSILKCQYFPGINPYEFNQYAPEHLRIPMIDWNEPEQFDISVPLAQKFVIEPYSESADRVVIEIDPKNKSIRGFTMDKKMHVGVFDEVFGNLLSAKSDLFYVDAWIDADQAFVRDMWTKEALSLSQRMEILKEIIDGTFGENEYNVQFVEYAVSWSGNKELNSITFSLALEQGYDGIIIRDIEENNPDVYVKSNIEVEVTCKEIKGDDAHNLELFVETEQNFGFSVSHGLKFSDREQCYNHKDQYIGSKLIVSVAGIDYEKEKVAFPVFIKWRENNE